MVTEQISSTDIAAQLDAMRTSGVLDPTSEGFNVAVVDYTALLEEQTKAIRVENATKLDDAKSKLGGGINSLVESLNLAALLVEKVTRVVWEYLPGSKGEEDEIRVYVNPVGRKPATKRATAANGGATGDRRDLTAIFDANATTDEKAKVAAIEAEFGPDGTDPNPKKRNSQLWSLKDRVANRASTEQAPASSSS